MEQLSTWTAVLVSVACRGCGATVDVADTVGDRACLTPDSAAGFLVDEAEVVFRGLCPRCRRAD